MNTLCVTIIIVNYNTKQLLQDCLHSLYTHTTGITFEVIVSDNGSTDGSIEMLKELFPQVILIENNANLGFGTANNKGLNIAKGKYIFYLNSDTVLLNNAVKIFYDFWENHNEKNKLGAIGANLLNANNQVIHSFGTFAGYKLSIKQLLKMCAVNFVLSILYILHIKPVKKSGSDLCSFYTGKVDYITGADLFMLNNSFARYDEDFFLYFEEADMQRKIAEKYLERLIIDGPQIQHLCGGTVGTDFSIKRKASFSRIQFELSRVRFLKKYDKHCKNGDSLPLFITKLIITIIWLNPFLFKQTKKYINTLWKI